MFENIRCVVLNASYEPLSVVSSRRALMMVLEGKALVIEHHPNGVIRSPTKKFPLPTQVRLKEYIKSRSVFRVPAQLTQRNLFLRDRYTCQYCKRIKRQLGAEEYLTRDHIQPEARGGKDSWTNVVAACRKCNNIKADYLLSEMDQVYFRYAEQAEDLAQKLTSLQESNPDDVRAIRRTEEALTTARDTAAWTLAYLTGAQLNPFAPTVFDIWARSGTLKLPPEAK